MNLISQFKIFVINIMIKELGGKTHTFRTLEIIVDKQKRSSTSFLVLDKTIKQNISVYFNPPLRK